MCVPIYYDRRCFRALLPEYSLRRSFGKPDFPVCSQNPLGTCPAVGFDSQDGVAKMFFLLRKFGALLRLKPLPVRAGGVPASSVPAGKDGFSSHASADAPGMMRFLSGLVWNPYLAAVREGLTLALPIIIAGTVAILVNGFPWDAYQELMGSAFGPHWKRLGGYIYNGTFGIISLVMVLGIGHSLAEDYNAGNPLDQVAPSIAGFISFSCLLCTMEPVSIPAGGELAFSLRWIGVYGLLPAIAAALISSALFRFFLRFPSLRITLYSGSAVSSVPQTLNTLVPAILTIIVFACGKTAAAFYGTADIHTAIYHWLSRPFQAMGENHLETALIYGAARHVLWFVGIHGANVLEPVMQELYVPAMQANIAGHQAGLPALSVFTKPFFDCYTSLGGSGSTLGLLIACLLGYKDSGARNIAKLSLIPSVFNVNEILLFGLPVVLSPVFLIPFILTPLVSTIIAYFACVWGIVPVTVHDVAWNVPVFFNGYLATGSVKGALLQAFNLLVAVAIYRPFVALDAGLRKKQFNENFKKLVDSAVEGDTTDSGPRLLNRPGAVGGLAHSLAGDMREALRRGELFLRFQPQVNSDTGRVYGVESLMRWQHPHIGHIPPLVFIGLAEDTGYILDLGLWAFEQSVLQMSEWRNAGVQDVVMSVNVSAKQLEDRHLPDKLMEILGRRRVPVESVKLEVTESVALTSHMIKNEVLARLHSLNFQLVIDDFGMGHSSLTYLKKFPVGSLKLDAVLSRDVLVSRSSCEIVSSVADLCNTLGINLVAEYVEDEAHLLKLRALGCRNVQGYFYSPPLSPEAAFRFITGTHKAYGVPVRRLPAECSG